MFSEDDVLEEFTPQIRREVVRYVNKDALLKITFLNSLLDPVNNEPDLLPIAQEFAIFLGSLPQNVSNPLLLLRAICHLINSHGSDPVATKLRPSVTNKGDDITSYGDEGDQSLYLQDCAGASIGRPSGLEARTEGERFSLNMQWVCGESPLPQFGPVPSPIHCAISPASAREVADC